MSRPVDLVAPKQPRGSRRPLGVLVALVVLAAAVLGMVAALQVHAGHRHTALGSTVVVGHWLGRHGWSDVVVVVIGAVALAVGVCLLAASVLPARRRLVAVDETHPGVTTGITRRGLRVDLAAVAEQVDGVASARARLGRRTVRVRAESGLRDRDGIEPAVVTAVAAELERLGLQRTRRVRASVSGPAVDRDEHRDAP